MAVSIALLSFSLISPKPFVIGLSAPCLLSLSFSARAAWSYAILSAAFVCASGRSTVVAICLSLSVFVDIINIEEFAMFEKPRMLVEEYITKKLLGRGKFEDGSEHPDPVPLAPPIGYVEQPNLWEQMRAMIRSEQLKQLAEAAGAETFEEADDFDVEDEIEPNSPYEMEEIFEPDIPANAKDTDRGSPSPGEGKGEGAKGSDEPVLEEPEPPASPQPPMKPAVRAPGKAAKGA